MLLQNAIDDAYGRIQQWCAGCSLAPRRIPEPVRATDAVKAYETPRQRLLSGSQHWRGWNRAHRGLRGANGNGETAKALVAPLAGFNMIGPKIPPIQEVPLCSMTNKNIRIATVAGTTACSIWGGRP